jgi:alpha-beta hydrolase superfamily lysophospholipase
VDSIGQYEDDVGDVIQQLRATRPGRRIVLAGHSMGGGISLRYALKPGLPDVDGYLLVAPYLGPDSPTTRLEETEASAAFLQVHVPRTLGLWVLNGFGITAFNGLRTIFFNLPQEMPLRSYSYRASVSMAPSDCGLAFQAISQPLLVVVGSADEAFHADRYEATIRPHSAGEVVVIDGASHDGVLTDPRTLDAIRSWSAKL